MAIVKPTWYAVPWAGSQALSVLTRQAMAAGFPSGIAQRPTRQDLNRALEFATNGVLSWLSRGMPEWDEAAQYPTGAVLRHDGRHWRANALIQGVTPGSNGGWEALLWRRSELDEIFLSIEEGDARFLTSANADALYYPRAEMASTFITPSMMAAQFAPISALANLLTRSLGILQYLTQAAAAARYGALDTSVPIGDLAALLLPLLTRQNDFFTQLVGNQTWLNAQAAESIFVSQTQAQETMQDKETAAMSVYNPAKTYAAGMLAVDISELWETVFAINMAGDAVGDFQANTSLQTNFRSLQVANPAQLDWWWGASATTPAPDLSRVIQPAPLAIYESIGATTPSRFLRSTITLEPSTSYRVRLHYYAGSTTYLFGPPIIQQGGVNLFDPTPVLSLPPYEFFITELDVMTDNTGLLALDFLSANTAAYWGFNALEVRRLINPRLTRIFRSQQDNNTGNALSDTAWWRPWSLPTVPVFEGNDARFLYGYIYRDAGTYTLDALTVPGLAEYPGGILMRFHLKGGGGGDWGGYLSGAGEGVTYELVTRLKASDFPLSIVIESSGNHQTHIYGANSEHFMSVMPGGATNSDLSPGSGGNVVPWVNPRLPIITSRAIYGASGKWGIAGIRWGDGGGSHGGSGATVADNVPGVARYGSGAGGGPISIVGPIPGGDGTVEIYWPPSATPWKLRNSVMAGQSTGNAVTPPMDTTGADLLVVFAFGPANSTPKAVVDSAGNTWVLAVASLWTSSIALYYCANPITSPTHTFTTSGVEWEQNSVFVVAFSGAAANPFEQAKSARGPTGSTSLQPGALKPSVEGALVVSAAVSNGPVTSVDSDFLTLADMRLGGTYPSRVAFRILPTPLSVNPTFVMTNGYGGVGAVIASFNPKGG
jgi:hypothetical protein